MKKSILLVFLFLAATLAACAHPNDLLEDVASAAVSGAQA
jgi:predicted small secreted protein